MTEIDKTGQNNLTNNIATSGSVVAEVRVVFSGGVTPNDARHAGRAALVVVSSRDIHSSEVHRALRVGGHSTMTARGRFLKLVPPSGNPENSLQELPDGTSVHYAEESSPVLLTEAPKPALVQSNTTTSLSRREISRRFVLNVFSPSNDPVKYGLLDLVQEVPKEESPHGKDNIIQFPTPKDLAA